MNNELLLLIKKHTDTLIEQTKTKPQETLEFKMNKQMQTFSFNPPINLVEEDKWLLAVSLFECTNSVFNITNENNSFSIIIPGHYQNKSDEKTIDDLNKLLELKSLELHIEEVKKRGNIIKIGDNEYKLSDFDSQKYEIIEELKNNKYNDLEDLVYRMRLSYDEIMDILDLKYIPTKRMGYSIEPNIYNVVDLNNTLKNILPNNVKIDITIDERKYKTDLKINQTLIFTNKSFFYNILGFTQSHSYPLDDIEGFYQLIAGLYKSERPINITGIDKVHLKCNVVDGSMVNGVREPILYSFALNRPPGHKIYKEPKVKLFKKINKRVLSHITFYLEDDDYKPVDFNNEIVSFTCQLIKIKKLYSYKICTHIHIIIFSIHTYIRVWSVYCVFRRIVLIYMYLY